MTIEDAIRHCIEVAEGCTVRECAEDHRQLADWLKDYKRLKTIELGKARCTTCKHYGTYAVECRECYQYNLWDGDVDG